MDNAHAFIVKDKTEVSGVSSKINKLACYLAHCCMQCSPELEIRIQECTDKISAAIVSDFVLILGLLSRKIASFEYANKAYSDFSAIYSHKANTFVRIFFKNLWIS